MPLEHGKGRRAFVANLKTEIAAGKPHKQALAIAYAEQRRARPAGQVRPGGRPRMAWKG